MLLLCVKAILMGNKLANFGFLVVVSLIFTQCANKGTATGGPKPTVKRAPNGRMVSLKETTPDVAPAKKATAKKVAPTKGQPTVTRDKTTGRIVGLKKK